MTYDPLATMPADLAPSIRATAQSRAAQAARGHYAPAVWLKCMDCCGWYRREVTQCALSGCALWNVRQKVFGLQSAKTFSSVDSGAVQETLEDESEENTT